MRWGRLMIRPFMIITSHFRFVLICVVLLYSSFAFVCLLTNDTNGEEGQEMNRRTCINEINKSKMRWRSQQTFLPSAAVKKLPPPRHRVIY